MTSQINSSLRGAIWRRVVQVSGVATELLGISATNGAPKLQVLLVPGNPGSAQYFATQLYLLNQSMGGGVEVLAVTHAGHDPKLPGDRLWSLQEQIQHKADFIRQYLLLPGRPPLIVAGHSIGAYIAVQAVAFAENSPDNLSSEASRPPILKVMALFPFFWIDRTQWRIRLLRVAAAMYEVLGRVAQVLGLLPPWLQRAVIRHFSKGLDDDAIETTQALLVRSSIRNNFYLAHTEFQELDQPPPWHLIRGLGARLHVLGCPEDVWMSRNQYLEMKQEVEGLQATWVEDVRHAYCTSRIQCEIVTEIMCGIMSDCLVQQQRSKQQQQQEQQANATPWLIDADGSYGKQGSDGLPASMDLVVQVESSDLVKSKI